MKGIKSKFTLVELIVVIVVLGILAAIIIPNIKNVKTESIVAALDSDARSIEVAVDLYGLDFDGKAPTEDGTPVGKNGPKEAIKVKDLIDLDYLKKGPKEKEVVFYLEEGGHVSWTWKGLTREEVENGTLKGKDDGGGSGGSDSNPDDSGTIDVYSGNFPLTASAQSSQIHQIEIKDLSKVDSIKSDQGSATILSVEGNIVTVKVEGGSSKKVQIGGGLIPADTKFVERSNFFPAVTQFLATSNFNEEEYTGRLNRGEYIGTSTESKNVYITRKSGDGLKKPDNSTYEWNGTSWVVTSSTNAFALGRSAYYEFEDGTFFYKWSDASAYSSKGNILKYVGELGKLEPLIIYDTPLVVDGRIGVTNPTVGQKVDVVTYYGEVRYSGDVYNVQKGTVGYKYSGDVTRPEKDTRTYEDVYEYSVEVKYTKK